MIYKWNDTLFSTEGIGKEKNRKKRKRRENGEIQEKKKGEGNESENQEWQGKNGWRGGKQCKHKMSSNPWQLGYPKNTIEFEPQIPFLS